MFKFIIKLFTFCLLLLSCDKFESHPYDVDISGEQHVNAKNITIIENRCLNKDTLHFAVISDTQSWMDETNDEVKSINSHADVDFVIHCGDVSDYGITKEFMWQRDIFNKLKVPYVVIIGNHDCLGNGEDAFIHIFGKMNYSFIAGRVKFVCLNTNALEFDYSSSVPDFDFIKQEVVRDSADFDRTVFCMHARPLCEQFNNNAADAFENYYIRRYPDVLFCINGHDHHQEILNIFDDGLLYYGCDCAKNRNYYIFTITPNGYSYELVNY